MHYPTGKGTNALVSGDLSGDGKLDIVTAGSQLSVLLGNGDGTFTLASRFGKGSTFGVSIGDFTRDGKLDVASSDGRDRLLVFLGNGDGTFTRGSSPQVGAVATQLVSQDLNGDGKLDLVAAALNILVLLGNGDGTFKAPVTYQCCSSSPNAMVMGDFNGDGRPDVATPFSAVGGYEVSILLGNGDGTLQQRISYPLSYAWAISAADFNNDGTLDLAFGQGFDGALEIFLGLSN